MGVNMFFKLIKCFNNKISNILIFAMLCLISLNVYSQPCSLSTITPKFSYSQDCQTKTIHFANTSIINSGSILSVNWNFGNGFSSIQANPIYTYASFGTYLVTLTIIHSSGCTAVKTDSIRVLPPPFADFSMDYDSACPYQQIAFTNLSIGSSLTYKWYFRDSIFFNAIGSVNKNPSKYFNPPLGSGYQIYNVKLEIIDTNGCIATITHPIVIKKKPIIDFLESGNFKRCENVVGSVSDTAVIFNFSDLSAISSYHINWGEGNGFVPVLMPFNNTVPTKHVYYGINSYPISIQATGTNGCINTFTDTFRILTIPLPEFTSLPFNAGCLPFNVFTINTSTGITSNTKTYINWGDNVTDTLPLGAMPGDTMFHTYTATTCINKAPYPFNIILTTKNECGSPFKSYGPINVFAPPKADIYTTINTFCVGNPVPFQNLSIPNYCANNPRTLYTWDLGDTIIGPFLALPSNPTPNLNHIYNQPGTYNIVLTAENTSPASTGKPGCGSTIDTLKVFIFETESNFKFDTVCLGFPTTFTDLSIAPGGSIVSRIWDFGDSTTSVQVNPNHVYTKSGKYVVSLSVTGNFGCTDVKIDTIIVDSLPDARFIYSNTCLGDSTFFTNFSIPNSDSIVSFLWDFGDGNLSINSNPIHFYQSSGIYNVKLTAFNSKGCQKDTTLSVTVHPNPIASFYMDTICSGYQKIFINNSIALGGSINAYSWNMGDGVGTCFQIDTIYNYPGTGNYPVYLKLVDVNGCIDDTLLTIFLGPVPIADFNFDTVCFLTPTHFTNTSDNQGVQISTSLWDFGDTFTSTLSNPDHIFGNLSSFNVSLKVYNTNGCVDSISKIIILDTLPTPNFTSTTVCNGDTTKFADLSFATGSSIISWLWDFGDGNTSTLQNPSHLYLNSGFYNVTLIITDSKGCSKDTIIAVEVWSLPFPSFSINNPCKGQLTNFISNIGNPAYLSWNWNFGVNNDSDSIQNPVYSYSQSGIYNVKLDVINGNGCKNDTIQTLIISPLPIADFVFDTVCFGNPTHFFNASIDSGFAITSWHWNFGDNVAVSDTNPIHLYNNVSLYNTTMSITNIYGCVDSITKLVKIDTIPNANFTSDSVCLGNYTQFIDLSTTSGAPIIGWFWDFGDGYTTNFQNPQHTYNGSGIVSVNLTVTKSNGCSNDTTIDVLVYNLPKPDFSINSVCVKNDILFTSTNNSFSPVISWLWNFDDGNSDTLQNPQHLYLNSGVYNVQLQVVDSNLCQSDTVKNIFISPLPIANFLFDTICQNEAILFTDISIDSGYLIASRNWNFGDSTTSSIINPAHFYNNPGLFNVQLKVDNIYGCIDSVSKTIIVDTLPIANFSANNVPYGIATIFTDNSIANATNIISWQWDFGDGVFSNLQNPFHTYLQADTFSVKLIVINNNGCKDTIIKSVIVFPLPTPDFNIALVCFGDSSHFIDISSSMGGNISSWYWNFGDGNFSNIQNPYHYYSNAGNYTVWLTITDINGSKDSISHIAIVNFNPIAQFSFDTVCSGFQTSFFDSSSTIGGSITNWNWDFGDGSLESFSQNVMHQYSTVNSTSSYNVSLKVIDNFGCKDTIIRQVIIYPRMKAEFISDTVCNGSPIQLIDISLSEAGNIVAWNWNFGNGIGVSSLKNPVYAYSNVLNNTLFVVELIATDTLGCKDTVYHQLLVNPQPIVHFNADTSCLGIQTFFSDSSYCNGGSLSTWNWNFGGTGLSTLRNPSHLFPSWGVFNTTLTVTDVNGCFDSKVIPVTIDSIPEVNFSFHGNCASGIINFTENAIPHGNPNASWNWNFGDSYFSTLQNPVHYYTAIDTFTVTLTVGNTNGCFGSFSKAVYVNPSLAYEFFADTVCLGMFTNFTDSFLIPTSQIVTWLWDFGDGSIATVNNPQHSYSLPGTYHVSLTVIDTNACVETIHHNVIVKAKPLPEFTSAFVCEGDSTGFSNNSFSIAPLTSYLWDFGDGYVSNINNPLHQYNSSGSYVVKLIVSNTDVCSDSVSKSVVVSPKPVAGFYAGDICAGFPVIIYDSTINQGSFINTWNWDFGDGDSLFISNPSFYTPNITHSYLNSGNYAIKLKVSNNACSDSAIRNIQVFPNPIAGFIYFNQCFNDTTFFSDTTASNVYPIISRTWDFGDGSNSNLQSPFHIYSLPGTYTVMLTVTDVNGCSFTVNKSIQIYPQPLANFTYTSTCFKDSTHFTDLSFGNGANINFWDWDFGDFSPGFSIQNPSHYYNVLNNYNVRLIVGNLIGCRDTLIANIAIDSLPHANFIFSSACLGSQTLFTNTSLNYGSLNSTWNWNFGDGIGTSVLQNPFYTYQSHGVYNVKLLLTNQKACKDSVIQTIQVDTIPVAGFLNSISCLNDTTFFTDTTHPTIYPITTWNWNFGDGNNSNIQNPSHVYAQAGNYTVLLTVTDSKGCIDFVNKNITVYPPPQASFAFSSTCFHDSTYFTDLSLGNGSVINYWNWDFGDFSTNSAVQNPVHYYNASQDFNVRLVVSNIIGCKDTLITTVKIDSLPHAGFTNTSVCMGSQSLFNNTSVSHGSANISWDWDFGDNNGSSVSENPFYTYQSHGIYYVKLIVTNQKACKDSVSLNIFIDTIPVAGFIAHNTCLNDTCFLIDTTQNTVNPIIAWNWNFGDGGISNLQNPYHIYTQAGNYNVILTVTDSKGCSNTISKNIIIYPLPIANFTYNQTCFHDSTHFTDLSFGNGTNINYWNWNFGDASFNSVSQNPIHYYNTLNNFNVSLIVSNTSGCKDTIILPVIIDSLPQAGFMSNTVCMGSQTLFNNISVSHGSVNNGWNWSFGDGMGSSVLQHPFYTYQSHGIYNVKLIVTNQKACKDSVVQLVQVDTIPIAGFKADSVCLGLPTHFTNQSQAFGNLALSYAWNFGDNSPTAVLVNPTHIYTNSGNYLVSLTVTDAHGCSKSIQKSIVVYSLPTAGFNAPPTQFPSATIFSNTSTGNPSAIINWNWNFGDGIGTSFSQNPIYSYAIADTFDARLIVTDMHGCKDSVINPVIVYVYNQFIISNFSFTAACANSPVIFNDSTIVGSGSGILSWFWDFGDFSSSTLQNPQHQYLNSGIYNVKLIVTGIGGISDTMIKAVTIFPKPVANFDNSGVCIGINKTFTNLSTVQGGNIISWLWNFGNGNTANTLNHSTVYNNLGTYSVQLIVQTDIGCTDSITKTIKVNSLPITNFLSDINQGCVPLFINFKDSSVVDSGYITTWNWSFGDGSSYITNVNQIGHSYLISGNYNVSVTVQSNSGCTNTMTIPNMIVVFQNPVSDFYATPNMTSILESNIIFTDNSLGANSWNWYFDDGDTSVLQSPSHVYNESGSFYPMLKVTSLQGCTDTISKKVIILKDASFYTPTAFTPNNDGYNDIFQVYGLDLEKGKFEMMIFNRWGEMVFYSQDYKYGWNGNMKGGGETCPDGVYVWKLNYTDGLGRSQKANGHLTLIR